MRLCPLLLIALLTATLPGLAQLRAVEVPPTRLPKELKHQGRLVRALRWTDASGDNTALIAETGPVAGAEPDSRSVALYAYRFVRQGAAPGAAQVPAWRVTDAVTDCQQDATASFVRDAFQVTDLNRDGVAEVWLMYKTACQGDVSPLDMKVIMYQGPRKYAMRGQCQVRVDATPTPRYAGGEYVFDAAFRAGPAAFRDFAQKLWQKNLLHTWE